MLINISKTKVIAIVTMISILITTIVFPVSAKNRKYDRLFYAWR